MTSLTKYLNQTPSWNTSTPGTTPAGTNELGYLSPDEYETAWQTYTEPDNLTPARTGGRQPPAGTSTLTFAKSDPRQTGQPQPGVDLDYVDVILAR
ncbi:hypothetical protein ACQEVC_24080 [Plantactinospora sp. CA-294935]|uniref:hypothetical protein n=1 Tax=Plantactinospora sp. CA-294935 TaxID=3240012 RepID=UPI003D89B59A